MLLLIARQLHEKKVLKEVNGVLLLFMFDGCHRDDKYKYDFFFTDSSRSVLNVK